jgi:uncharacterized protein (DUF488 family)
MDDRTGPPLYTIGHSNHSLAYFLELLDRHQIEAIADVRSMPYSRYVPHFNPKEIKSALSNAGLTYVYFGKELGARPDDPACYVKGRISYERLALRPDYQTGLARIRQGAEKYRLALMCTEKDPLDCHRMILICRQLRPERPLLHVLGDGALETNQGAELRLCARFDLRPNLFDSQADVIEQAYERQAGRIAYRRDGEGDTGGGPEGDVGR